MPSQVVFIDDLTRSVDPASELRVTGELAAAGVTFTDGDSIK